MCGDYIYLDKENPRSEPGVKLEMFFGVGAGLDSFPFLEVDYHAPSFKSKAKWHLEAKVLIEILDLLLVGLEDLVVVNHIKCRFIAISRASPGDAENVSLIGFYQDYVPVANTAGVAVGAITASDKLDGLANWDLVIPLPRRV